MKRWKLPANFLRPSQYSSSTAFWIQWAKSLEGGLPSEVREPYARENSVVEPGCSEVPRLGQRRLRTVLKFLVTLKISGAQPAETESQVETYIYHLRRQRR